VTDDSDTILKLICIMTITIKWNWRRQHCLPETIELTRTILIPAVPALCSNDCGENGSLVQWISRKASLRIAIIAWI